WGHHAEVLALGADETNLGRADAIVDPRAGFAHRRGVMWSAGYGAAPSEAPILRRKLWRKAASFNRILRIIPYVAARHVAQRPPARAASHASVSFLTSPA